MKEAELKKMAMQVEWIYNFLLAAFVTLVIAALIGWFVIIFS